MSNHTVRAQKAAGERGQFGELPHQANTVELEPALASRTPVEIDTRLSELYQKRLRTQDSIAARRTDQHYMVGDSRLGYSGTRWGMTWNEVVEKTNAIVSGQHPSYRRDTIASNMNEITALETELNHIRGQESTLEDEFVRRGGWTRAFLVTNGNGHVHSSMYCSTCNRNGAATRFGWMTQFSGADEGDIVAAAGWRACTRCYPSAPIGDESTLPTSMFTDDELAAAKAREERAQAKAIRDAVRIEKALTADGSEFVVPTGVATASGRRPTTSFKTERAATSWAVEQIAMRKWWYTNPHSKLAADLLVRDEAVGQIVAAIAVKYGRDPGEVRAELDAKAAAQAKRNRWI